MITKSQQKEVDKLIRQYSKLSNEALREMKKEIEESSGTMGDRNRNKLRLKAITALLM